MGLRHEGRVDLVPQRRLARRALEQERLVRERERIAVDEVDLHLRRPIFVDQRVDLDLLVLAELVDVVEQRIELVHRGDAVRLPSRLRTTRAAHRRLERIVGVLVLLDQVELELGRHHGLPAALSVELEHVTQHMARRHGDPPPVRVETIVDHLRGGLGRPGHAADGFRIRLEDNIDLGRAHGFAGLERIVAGYRLQKDAFRQPHAAVFGELLGGHDLAPRDSRHIGNDGLDLGNPMVAEELPNLARHK